MGRASTAIIDQIRTLLLDGGLREGDRLPSERELAERFGVSRVTVRDALRALEAVGLLEIRVGARGGAFVTTPTAAVVGETIANMLMMSAVTPEDIAETRLMFELGTVTLACSRASEEDLERLRELCRRSQEELKTKTYERQLSWEFHALLAQAAHNPAVESITSSFRGTLSMHPVRMREPRNRAHARTVEEHIQLVDALERRDGDAARQIMAKHLLRGTGLDKRSAVLLDWWNTKTPRSQRASSRRAE